MNAADKLKAQIKSLMGSQYKDSDEPLITELLYNFKMQKRAKEALDTEGLVINTVRDPDRDPYWQKSPYFAIYDTCLKNINALYTKLNISPLDRRSWNLEEGEDDFDELYG